MAYHIKEGGEDMNAKICRVSIGTMTQALRAQSALAAAAIPSTVVKYTDGEGSGCAYGLSFSCAQNDNIATVLTGARIRVRRWMRES